MEQFYPMDRETRRDYPSLSVRRPAEKPWRKPLQTPVKVYNVDPRNFRELVQSLTGSTEHTSEQYYRETTMAPLRLCAPSVPPVVPTFPPSTSSTDFLSNRPHYYENQDDPLKLTKQSSSSFTDLLSPSWSAWCSSPAFNPGTTTSYDSGAVL